MAMTVTRRKDYNLPSVITNKIADVRGGVSIATSELGGGIVREGAVISAPDAKGVCHLIKTAALVKAATTTDVALTVDKGHNFKVGDAVMAVKDKAVAIEKIEYGAGSDTITLAATLGVALEVGDAVAEAAAAAKDSAAVLKYQPFAVVGTGMEFSPISNLITDAWIFATTKGNKIPSFVASELKGVINY